MCEFISWIEYQDQIYFLDDTKLNTKEGRKLLKSGYVEDILGHGAIRHFYPEMENMGRDRECTDFSNPKNFPPEIVKAIKKGLFENFSVCPDILIKTALAEYEKIERPARAEYEKIKQTALAEYGKIKQTALAVFISISGQTALAEYEKIERPALAEYEKIERPARAEYEKIEQTARAEYEKIKRPAFWRIARLKKNRKKEWK